MQHLVTVFSSISAPKTYNLDSFGKDTLYFGRGSNHGDQGTVKNDIQFDEHILAVSRAHGFFYKKDGEWYIYDDKSTNGLKFNHQKIPFALLENGLRFSIGNEKEKGCVISVSFVHETVSRGTEETLDVDVFSLAVHKRYVIGRGKDCDIVLNHPSVSRHHCLIEHNENGYFIRDHHSTNGLMVNGTTLSDSRKLQSMDRIAIADVTMIFNEDSLFKTQFNSGVGIQAVDLCKTVPVKRRKTKMITNHVDLHINSGEFVAIIGGSGAGKTTLMNCLSGMTDYTSGEVLINSEPLSKNKEVLKGIIGYVPQSDIVYDDLTLERMLMHSAHLRMPEDASKEEINAKIDETLRMVELSEHRQTMISKLSGGQKKRASIAVELLANPRLFFLDEPFSGLDPGTEKKLMVMLKKISRSGHTVIMVTHSVLSLDLCDRLICMGSGGRLCYSGKPDSALRFFGQTEYADIYDLLDKQSDKYQQKFENMTRRKSVYIPSMSTEEEGKKRHPDGFRQFRILSSRYTELSINRTGRLILLMVMPVVLTALVCLAFHMDGTLETLLYNLLKSIGIKSESLVSQSCHPFATYGDTKSAMFTFACAAFWIGIFNAIQEISKENSIYTRESFTGVRDLPYLMSKFCIIFVICLVQAAIMTAILMLMANTERSTSEGSKMIIELNSGGIVFTNALWLEFYVTTLLTMVSAACLGLLISAMASNDMALVLCPVALLPQILFSNVVTELSGLTDAISYAVSCRWSSLAYCASAKIGELASGVTPGSQSGEAWTKITIEAANQASVSGAQIDASMYAENSSVIFGLNPVLGSWVIMILIAVCCMAIAMLALYMRRNSLNLRGLFRRWFSSSKKA